MKQIFESEAYSPSQIAVKVESQGVTKARLPLLPMAMLGMLAGGFIGLGALYYTLVISDASLGFAASRALGGVVFSLGLILVIVGGAELFTGNNLLAMAWAEGKISSRELARNWLVVYATNAIGAIGLAAVVYWSDHGSFNGGAVARQYLMIAAAKTAMPFGEAFFKGVLCNLLVCLAVWLCMAGRSVTDKVLAIIFPVSAFVAAGFEHCVANMYFISLAIFMRGGVEAPAGANLATLDWGGFVSNLVPVTLGNIVGGSALVALVYYFIYRRGLRN